MRLTPLIWRHINKTIEDLIARRYIECCNSVALPI